MKRPKFCPNIFCDLHRKDVKGKNWYYRSGKYQTAAFGEVQRFVCKNCGKSFSTQTFSVDYYAKKLVSYRDLLEKVISTSNTRDISRDFKCSTGTVKNKISRLARQAIAVHLELREGLICQENLVADGFESFCVSQYFPNNINLLLLKNSQYLYYANYVTIRRKGRMKREQKQKRDDLEKIYHAPYKGIEISFHDLLHEVADIYDKSNRSSLTLFTDEKTEYCRAINRHKNIKKLVENKNIKHQRISSKRARVYNNPLFAANYLDRQIRKDLANHVRETVCFARNVNNCMERLAVYIMYHNYFKVYREKERRNNKRTHAEVAGIKKSEIVRSLKTVFTQRRFLSLENIKGYFYKLWNRSEFTPLKKKSEWIPKYVAA